MLSRCCFTMPLVEYNVTRGPPKIAQPNLVIHMTSFVTKHLNLNECKDNFHTQLELVGTNFQLEIILNICKQPFISGKTEHSLNQTLLTNLLESRAFV